MAQSFFIPGRLPSLNDLIEAAKGHGGRGYGYSKLKRQWTDSIALLAKAARLAPMARGRFRFEWHEAAHSKHCHSRDPDNVAGGGRKLILDGLKTASVIPDDTAKQVAGWTDDFVTGGPVGVRVTLEPEDTGDRKETPTP